VNVIPANMIERIEVLKQGASAIYGSDAIGGVVNFITRKNYSGGEMLSSYGRSHEGDGTLYDSNITWGSSTGAGNVVVGLGYNRQDEIRSADRVATSAPFGYLFNELTPNFGTSSRGPNGRFFVESGQDCASVTRIEGTTGSSPSDFRCYVNNFGNGPTDRYNFQPENLAQTPSRRVNAFMLANQNLDYGLKLFGSAFYNNTRANGELAPEPFDNGTNYAIFGHPVSIAANSMYNPFAQQIDTYALRATLAGNRVIAFDTDTFQATVGLKGLLLDQYTWSTSLSYGRLAQDGQAKGFLNFSQLEQQLGPSYDDPEFGPSCGTPGARIPNCTPINILGTEGDTIEALNTTTHSQLANELGQFAANITGDVMQLPAGPLGAAVGFEFRKEHLTFEPDQLARENHLSESNSGPTAGSTNVRELYAEANVPILNDMFLVHSLSASLGARYSSYSKFGTTTNAKYGLEYRPYSDLLVRATYTDVFRAPTILDLYGGPAQNAPPYADPCEGIEEAEGTDPNHDAACQNVARDGTFSQGNVQASTVLVSNPDLDPEEGYAADVGFVFNPSFYSPLTLELDFWRYSIDESIETLGIQTSLNACYNNGVLCENVARGPDGQLVAGIEPVHNVGSFLTSGIDLGIRLSYQNTELFGMSLGNFVVGADTTYLREFNFKAIEDGALVSEVNPVGTYDPNVFGGSFPRWRSLAYLFWNMGPWSAALNNYFIGPMSEGSRYFEHFQLSAIDLGDAGECDGVSEETVVNADGDTIRCNRDIGIADYVDVSGSYNWKDVRTTFTLGIRDLFNESSPLIVGGFNGATDTGAYRSEGRSFYAKVKYLFK
jgi:iron complex outermembrane recepter protein